MAALEMVAGGGVEPLDNGTHGPMMPVRQGREDAMLHGMKEIEEYAIRATDGTIGYVRDCYFDDEAWVIRYLVVEAGTWLRGREVLISPIAIADPDWEEKVLHVLITKDQVRNSPGIDSRRPVSRQHEIQWLGYYRYPHYWRGNGARGNGATPPMHSPKFGSFTSMSEPAGPSATHEFAAAEAARHANDDVHLRSGKEVLAYQIHATDGPIGHVSGLLVDDETWSIRYIVVNTSQWWVGHHVLLSPEWIDDIAWSDARLSVNLTRAQLQGAPPYESTSTLNRDGEAAVFEYYGRTGYWSRQTDSGSRARHA